MSVGGLEENMLKKLYGLRLGVPNSSTVLTSAIGLGPMAPNKILWRSLVIRSSGENEGISLGLNQNYSFPSASRNLFKTRFDFIETTYICRPILMRMW